MQISSLFQYYDYYYYYYYDCVCCVLRSRLTTALAFASNSCRACLLCNTDGNSGGVAASARCAVRVSSSGCAKRQRESVDIVLHYTTNESCCSLSSSHCTLKFAQRDRTGERANAGEQAHERASNDSKPTPSYTERRSYTHNRQWRRRRRRRSGSLCRPLARFHTMRPKMMCLS